MSRLLIVANRLPVQRAHDGSDDGLGHGVTRMLTDATILMTIPLPPNVRLGDSSDRFVVVKQRPRDHPALGRQRQAPATLKISHAADVATGSRCTR